MIRIRFSAPRGHGPEKDGFESLTDLPAIPRKDENVVFRINGVEHTFRAHVIEWCPNEEDFHVYIVLRDA